MRESGSAGGVARAKKLTSEQRKSIASKAANSRWDKTKNVPQSDHTGVLEFGDIEMSCDVLSDGTRIVTQQTFIEAMGLYRSGSSYRNFSEDDRQNEVPFFLSQTSFRPHVKTYLPETGISLTYRTKKGHLSKGIKADIIPKICEVFLDAGEDPDARLGRSQLETIRHAKRIMRALAHTGIVALIDEATGYQDVRSKEALSKIFAQYLSEEKQRWVKTFPLDFYKEIFRLRGWKFDLEKRPGCVAGYTNDFVYHRVAPELLNELNRRNPVKDGRRRAKHHQYFSLDQGHPKLRAHIEGVTALLKVSDDWETAVKMINKAYPKFGENSLNLVEM